MQIPSGSLLWAMCNTVTLKPKWRGEMQDRLIHKEQVEPAREKEAL